MTSHPSGTGLTPVDWIDDVASRDPGRPALVFAEGAVTYGQLLDSIAARRSTLTDDHRDGHVVDVAMRSDLASIVEVLAIQAAGGCPLPYAERPIDVAHLAAEGAIVGISTSGSSGGPKVVPLTMGNITAAVRASSARLGTSATDRWLVPLPLHHIGGLSVLFRVFEAGAVAVVSRFDESVPTLIERTEPTIASMVPTMVRRLMRSAPDAIASIGSVLTGGGPATSSLMADAARAGVTVLPTYGMTEASSQVATVAPGEAPVGVGRPLDGFDVAIDAAGRIVIDGPAVFGGYLGGEPRMGAFTTSDLGSFDREGNLTVIGRADDVAVSGGENVLLPHVEDVIRVHGGVADVAVVSVADPEWGSAVCAAVVGADPEAVVDSVRPILQAHEVPRRWLTIPEIPLLGNGKPDRAAIEAFFTDR